MSVQAPARRLMPQNIDDWPQLVTAQNARPELGSAVTDELRELVDAYNQRIGTLATRDTKAVAEGIRRAHFENDHSAYGSATCVIINGLPMSGKTHAALTCAFSETRDIWAGSTEHPMTRSSTASSRGSTSRCPSTHAAYRCSKGSRPSWGRHRCRHVPQQPTTWKHCGNSHHASAFEASSSMTGTASVSVRARTRGCWPTSSRASSPVSRRRSSS